jgi:alpha-beta hydrolase superfamily lysophospholipase
VSEYQRKPFLIVQRQEQRSKDVYGSIGDAVVLQAQLLADDRPARTAVIGMHPMASPGYLPMFSALARGGVHVIACATRYSSGDAGLQMENVLLDLAACVRDAKERLGYENVVLAGWSGGGSLMAGYQAEAEQRVITQTAAGEPTALTDTELLPGDGLLLLAAHRSRHRLFTEFLDASITDELRPDTRDPALDLYGQGNPAQPPYEPDFFAGYRAAQIARNRKITAWAKEELAQMRKRDNQEERCFVVHGTMADPRWLDPTIDPNGRQPRWCYMGEPRLVNNSPSGLGRYSSTRSWLSQWSYDDAQVDSVDAAPRITVPTLVLENGRDDAVPTSHPREVFAQLASKDKEYHRLDDANHYFSGTEQRSHLNDAVRLVQDWMNQRGLES